MNRSAGPGLRGSRSSSDRNGYVLRRAEALERRRGGRGSREVSTTVVGSVLLFVGRHVAKVRLHRGDVRLVLRICELGNRDRGKNADDDDDDQKLDQRKTFLAAHLKLLKLKNGWASGVGLPSNLLVPHCEVRRIKAVPAPEFGKMLTPCGYRACS